MTAANIIIGLCLTTLLAVAFGCLVLANYRLSHANSRLRAALLSLKNLHEHGSIENHHPNHPSKRNGGV